MPRKIIAVVMTFLLMLAVGCGKDTSVSDKVTNESVLSTVYSADQEDKICDLVKKSDLSDEDKNAFDMVMKGKNKEGLNGRTVQEIIDVYKRNVNDNKAGEDRNKQAPRINTEVTISAAYKCDSIFADHMREDDGYNARLDLVIKNKSSKTLKAVQIEYTVFNDFREEIFTYKTDITKLNIPPGQSESSYYVYSDSSRESTIGQQISDISSTNVNASVKVLKAVYTDGTLESANEAK